MNKKLCCGCGDSRIGPMDKKEYQNNLELLGKIAILKNVIELKK